MGRWPRWIAACVAVACLAAAGCAPRTDFSARFLRYENLPNGDRVAIIQPTAQGAEPGEIVAYSKLDDLVPGELVLATAEGKEWDQPQYMPSASVVERAALTP